MKLAMVFLQLVTLVGCSPKKSHSALKAAEPPAMSSLIGSWMNCESYSRGAIVGIKSSAIVYTFKDDKSVVMKAEYYTDEACRTLFSTSEAESYLKGMQTLGKGQMPGDVREAVLELSRPLIEELPYQATLVPLGEVGAIDFLRMQNPSFTSYRIVADTLHIAHVCQEEDCESLGDTPTTRAMNMVETDEFVRQ